MNTEELDQEQFVEDVGGAAEGGQTGTEGGSDTAAPKPVTQADLDAAFEKLGSTISTAVTPRKEEAPMSEDDQRKLWAIYNPEETQKDFMRKFFRMQPEATEDDVKAARELFSAMQNGLVRQSVVGARNLFTMELQKLRDEYAPMAQYFRDAKARELQTDFFAAFPALGEKNEDGSPRFMTAVRMAAQDLAQQTFADRPSYFKALAERAAGIVSGIIPGFALGATPKTKSSTTTPRLPRTSAGGTGGTARGGEANGDTKVQRGANGDDAGTLDWMG